MSAKERSLTADAMDSPKKTTSGLCTSLVTPSSAHVGHFGNTNEEYSAPSSATCTKVQQSCKVEGRSRLHLRLDSFEGADQYARTRPQSPSIVGLTRQACLGMSHGRARGPCYSVLSGHGSHEREFDRVFVVRTYKEGTMQLQHTLRHLLSRPYTRHGAVMQAVHILCDKLAQHACILQGGKRVMRWVRSGIANRRISEVGA
jgi:hypothetical protein